MDKNPEEKLRLLYIGSRLDVINAPREKDSETEVVVLDNGLQGIDYLNKHKNIDAIISDYNLPGIQGDKLASHIKTRLGFTNCLLLRKTRISEMTCSKRRL